jgi:hypothetical protein
MVIVVVVVVDVLFFVLSCSYHQFVTIYPMSDLFENIIRHKKWKFPKKSEA